jgi:hypothetical protein
MPQTLLSFEVFMFSFFLCPVLKLPKPDHPECQTGLSGFSSLAKFGHQYTLKKFLWQNIICRFRVPKKITVDNTKQLDYNLFKDFCYHMGIEVAFALVYQPWSNGAAERTNALIFTTIKKCLEDQKKGKWVVEPLKVVWSHNTSVSGATNFMPFELLFAEEPVTPEEIKFQSARIRLVAISSPIEVESKDLLEPKRMRVIKNLHAYQVKMRARRDKKVKEKTIEVGDLVLLQSLRIESFGKLEPKWLGLYLIT